MSVKPWLEYIPEKLSFARGPAVEFPASARLLYNPAENIIALENPGANASELLRDHAAAGHELRRIEYAMQLELPRVSERLGFFHPMKPGNGVRVRTNDRGQLFFMQDHNRPLFSKDYTVSDVSRGAIKSDRAVWQFHGYRHEH